MAALNLRHVTTCLILVILVSLIILLVGHFTRIDSTYDIEHNINVPTRNGDQSLVQGNSTSAEPSGQLHIEVTTGDNTYDGTAIDIYLAPQDDRLSDKTSLLQNDSTEIMGVKEEKLSTVAIKNGTGEHTAQVRPGRYRVVARIDQCAVASSGVVRVVESSSNHVMLLLRSTARVRVECIPVSSVTYASGLTLTCGGHGDTGLIVARAPLSTDNVAVFEAVALGWNYLCADMLGEAPVFLRQVYVRPGTNVLRISLPSVSERRLQLLDETGIPLTEARVTIETSDSPSIALSRTSDDKGEVALGMQSWKTLAAARCWLRVSHPRRWQYRDALFSSSVVGELSADTITIRVPALCSVRFGGQQATSYTDAIGSILEVRGIESGILERYAVDDLGWPVEIGGFSRGHYVCSLRWANAVESVDQAFKVEPGQSRAIVNFSDSTMRLVRIEQDTLPSAISMDSIANSEWVYTQFADATEYGPVRCKLVTHETGVGVYLPRGRTRISGRLRTRDDIELSWDGAAEEGASTVLCRVRGVGRIEGHVVDFANSPLAASISARVVDRQAQELWGPVSLECKSGVFELDGLCEGDWVVEALTMSGDSLRQSCRVTQGETAAVALKGTAERSISGRVIDEESRPVAGARVDVFGDATDSSMLISGADSTDAEGNFTVKGAANMKVFIVVSGEEIVSHRQDLDVGMTSTGDICVRRALRGTIRLVSDMPNLQPERLTVKVMTVRSADKAIVGSDERLRIPGLRPSSEGVFVVPGVPIGGIVEFVVRPATASSNMPFVMDRISARIVDEAEVVVMLREPPCKIEGRVRNSDGAGVAWAVLRLNADSLPGDLVELKNEVFTDENGVFCMCLPELDMWRVRVDHPDYLVKEEVIRSPSQQLDIVLERGRAVTGTVVEQSGNPVARAIVQSADGSVSATCSAEGLFVMRVAMKETLLRARKGSLRGWVELNEEYERVQIVVRETGSLSVLVTSNSGRRMPGVRVELVGVKWSAITNEVGVVVSDELPSGEYMIRVGARTVMARTGETTSVTVDSDHQ